MNNKELDRIIKEIKKGTGKSITAIAEKATVDRSYLSSTINAENEFELEDSYVGKFASAFPTYFTKQQITTDNKTTINNSLIESSLKEIRDYVIAILTGQMAGNEVIMGSLDRLEKNPKGSLSAEADKLALQLARRLKTIQTDSHVNNRKKDK